MGAGRKNRGEDLAGLRSAGPGSRRIDHGAEAVRSGAETAARYAGKSKAEQAEGG